MVFFFCICQGPLKLAIVFGTKCVLDLELRFKHSLYRKLVPIKGNGNLGRPQVQKFLEGLDLMQLLDSFQGDNESLKCIEGKLNFIL